MVCWCDGKELHNHNHDHNHDHKSLNELIQTNHLQNIPIKLSENIARTSISIQTAYFISRGFQKVVSVNWLSKVSHI